MKNIHVLPTEKPSRLHYYSVLNFGVSKENLNWKQGRHIYITNDEEIKDEDYGLIGKEVGKIILTENGYEFLIGKGVSYEYGDFYSLQKVCKKIILTTDVDLISNGVQAIDDKFLEWFVKNPSCEEVKIKLVEFEVDMGLGDSCIEYGSYYEIIIPKEEPKQETLEEAMNRNGYHDEVNDTMWREGVKFGAKWQQEQILQFLYSEITERRPYSSSKMCEEVIKFIEQLNNKK